MHFSPPSSSPSLRPPHLNGCRREEIVERGVARSGLLSPLFISYFLCLRFKTQRGGLFSYDFFHKVIKSLELNCFFALP